MMTGWIVAVVLAGGAWLLAWRVLDLPRAAWEAVGAALLLGLAGYAWTGRPAMTGALATATTRSVAVDERVIDIRAAMGGGFGSAYNWLLASDGALRAGLPSAAVTYLRSGIRENPDNADLWLGLGNALVTRAEGRVTPAARFAYARSAALAPDHPGPWFFLGLANLREGGIEETRRLWRQSLRRSRPDAEWRPAIAAALATLDAMPAESNVR